LKGLRALVSSRTLDDVPGVVRIGSPYDAPDREVRQWAKRGILHPKTNYGVVYRVAFAPVLQVDEEPMTMPQGDSIDSTPQGFTIRFGGVASGRLKRDRFLVGDESEGQGWVLITTLGIRWHYDSDGLPALGSGRSHAWGMEGYRFAPFQRLLGVSSRPQRMLFGGVPLEVDVYFFIHQFEGMQVVHMIGFSGPGSPENALWLEAVCQAAETVNPAFRRGLMPRPDDS
jgi:hypothetical protein